MEYKTGFSIKPYSFTQSGAVLFTDGVNNDLFADQITCQAYGYRFDKGTGTCFLSKRTSNVNTSFDNTTNLIKGNNNSLLGSENVIVSGNENTTFATRNSVVVGELHTIEEDNNNTSILGGKGAAITREAEVAIGGGVHNPISDGYISRRQMSFIALTGETYDNTATKLTVQGDGSSYINVRNNSILGYEIYLTRFELGGSAGTAGNYSFREIKGAVQIDNSYNMAFVIGFTRNIAKIGVNGTFTMVDSSATDPDTGIDIKSITVEVTDRNNVNNLWSASVYLHEVVSTAITF